MDQKDPAQFDRTMLHKAAAMGRWAMHASYLAIGLVLHGLSACWNVHERCALFAPIESSGLHSTVSLAFLINRKADMLVKDQKGYTPLELAILHGVCVGIAFTPQRMSKPAVRLNAQCVLQATRMEAMYSRE